MEFLHSRDVLEVREKFRSRSQVTNHCIIYHPSLHRGVMRRVRISNDNIPMGE